jgi:hypothetical protein
MPTNLCLGQIKALAGPLLWRIPILIIWVQRVFETRPRDGISTRLFQNKIVSAITV